MIQDHLDHGASKKPVESTLVKDLSTPRSMHHKPGDFDQCNERAQYNLKATQP